MATLLFLFIGGMVIFGLTQGYIGIYGAAIYREKNPKLFWAQISVAIGVLVLLAIVIVRGD